MLRLNLVLASACVAALALSAELQAQQSTPQPNAQRGRPAADQSRDRLPQQHQAGVSLTEAIVKKLIKTNEAEVELAKLALGKAENEELKKFAQTLVDDHQAFNQKLSQMAGDHSRGSDSAPGAAQQRATFQQTSTQLGQPNNSPAATTGQNTSGQIRQASQSSQRGAQTAGMQDAQVPHQLTQIMDEACDNSLKMTKEMLSKYEGQDFQMAFLGQQCVAHIYQLAELKAIENSGPEELKSVAGEASKKVEAHLEQAKQLAKKLEDDRKNS
jgi:predicted outer membrane protein